MNAQPTPVMVLSPSEAFERQLAQSNDSTVLRGKVVYTTTFSSTLPVLALGFIPTNLGVRASQLAGVFSRYRIKAAQVKFIGAQGTAGVPQGCAVGWLDDVSTSDAPSTLSGVLELRCSALALPVATTPTYSFYQPVDKTKWYYCVSGNDGRFQTAASLYVAPQTAIGSITFEIDYTIVFSGADDTGAL